MHPSSLEVLPETARGQDEVVLRAIVKVNLAHPLKPEAHNFITLIMIQQSTGIVQLYIS